MTEARAAVSSPLPPVRRVCLLLDEDRKIMRWAAKAVGQAIEEQGISFPLIIIKTADSWKIKLPVSKRIVARMILGWRRFWGTTSVLTGQVVVDSVPWAQKAKVVSSDAIRVGKYGTALPPETIKLIQSENIDLIFRRGFGILKGEVLTCVPWGVISYHVGDIARYRGGGAMVESYCQDEENIVISVQQLTPGLDRGALFNQIVVPIRQVKSYRQAIERVYEAMATSLSPTLARMNQPGFEARQPEFEHTAYPMPTFLGLPKLLVRYLKAEAIHHWRYFRKKLFS